MKKTTKSLIAAVAAITLCAANIPMASLSPIFTCSSITVSAAEEGQCGANAYYTIDDNGVLTITGTGEINKNAFKGNDKITSVIFEEGITSIGESAFSGCTSLEAITIPEWITSIKNFAFSSCTSLKTITVADGVTSINQSAFYHCDSVEKMYCYANPNSLKWFTGPYELKEDRETICYVPVKYYEDYLKTSGRYYVTFRIMPISIEQTLTLGSDVQTIDLNESVSNAEGVVFSVTEGSELPVGLTLENGVITGAPELAGDFTTTFDISKVNTVTGTATAIGTADVKLHIDKADPVMSVKLKKDKVTTEDVLTENDFIVNSNTTGTTEWENLSSELTEGEVVLSWTFTPDDETNYNPVSGTITITVEAPEIEEEKSFTLTDVQYGTTYDLSEYDCEHISGVSIKFANQTDNTTNGCVVLGNYVSSTLLNNVTVNGNTIDIAIDQYSLQSALDTFTIYDWYNTAATLGEIESVTFYYIDDEEINIAPDSVILQNSDNETANQFDLSEYDYENVQSVTLVFNGITYNGCGAIITGEYGNIGYNFNMNRTNNYSITIDVNGELTDKLSFSNYWNLKELSYIALNY